MNCFLDVVARGAVSQGAVALFFALVNLVVHLPFSDLPVLRDYHLGDMKSQYDYVIELTLMVLSSGIAVMAMYLTPNLSERDVTKYIEKAMHRYRTGFKHGPFVLVGDLNVDIMQSDRLVQHTTSRYALRCVSYGCKRPTTIRGTCIDVAFSNFPWRPIIDDPLAAYFTDHKVIILKGKRVPELIEGRPSCTS